jgi:hypothetical protein
MSATTITAPVPLPRRRGTIALLSFAGLIAVVFFAAAALPYLVSSAHNADRYAAVHGALLVHIAGGSVALFAGPIQLWLGLADRRMAVHRKLGILYIAAVVVSAGAAYWLALHPSLGFAFGAGLAGLATAWLATTALAFMAIRRSLVEQHKEWMIRSYVVTFSFVNFRVGLVLLQALGIGTLADDGAVMAWACWSIPLLVTELFLQGRKIVRVDRLPA